MPIRPSVVKNAFRLSAAAVVAATLALSGCSAAKQVNYTPPEQAAQSLPDEMVAELTSATEYAMAASGASGAIVGVWAPWSGEWVTGLGTQSGADSAEVTAGMTFRITQTTRLMTCDVLFGMAADGLVKLSDPVSEYVSSVPNLDSVTLLQLCNGTGGLGSSAPSIAGNWLKTPERIWNPREAATYGVSRDPQEPGVGYRDSDAGYFLLGVALEKAGGKSASQLISEYVTVPLRLPTTSLPDPAPASTQLAGNILWQEEGVWQCDAPIDITRQSSSIGFTSAGATSTITELGSYTQATAAQALGTEGRWDNAFPAYTDAPSWHQAIGGGYLVGPLVGQHGWVPGYLSASYSDPTTGFTVSLVLNNSTAGPDLASALAWQLAAIASKAPAAAGVSEVAFALPFTADQYRDQITALALCPLPTDPEPEPEPAPDETGDGEDADSDDE